MQIAAPDTASSLAPPGTICRRCSYALKGLSIVAACTECGEQVSRGLDPLWWGNRPVSVLRRAGRNARWAFAVTAAWAALNCASIVVYYGPGTGLLASRPVFVAFTSAHTLLTVACGLAMLMFLRALADLWPIRSRLCAAVAWCAGLYAALRVAQSLTSLLYTGGPLNQTFILLWGFTPITTHLIGMLYAVVFLRLGRLMSSRPMIILSIVQIVLTAFGLLFTVPTSAEMLSMALPRSNIAFLSGTVALAYRAQSIVFYLGLPILPLQLWIVVQLTRRLIAAKEAGA